MDQNTILDIIDTIVDDCSKITRPPKFDQLEIELQQFEQRYRYFVLWNWDLRLKQIFAEDHEEIMGRAFRKILKVPLTIKLKSILGFKTIGTDFSFKLLLADYTDYAKAFYQVTVDSYPSDQDGVDTSTNKNMDYGKELFIIVSKGLESYMNWKGKIFVEESQEKFDIDGGALSTVYGQSLVVYHIGVGKFVRGISEVIKDRNSNEAT